MVRKAESDPAPTEIGLGGYMERRRVARGGTINPGVPAMADPWEAMLQRVKRKERERGQGGGGPLFPSPAPLPPLRERKTCACDATGRHPPAPYHCPTCMQFFLMFVEWAVCRAAIGGLPDDDEDGDEG